MKLSLLLALLLPVFIHAQSIKYTEVVTVDSLKKEQLYKNAKEWIVYSFKDSKSVIQLDDKEEGKLIGKGNFKYYGKPFVTGTNSDGVVNFTLTIEIKDGRYRYTFDDFNHEAYRSGSSIGEISQEPKGLFKAANKSVRKDCEKQMEKIIPQLKKAMLNSKSSDF